jgi:NAD(P)-dependent dehydrogenase (short-subunit alcohol dehydrogenase family)
VALFDIDEAALAEASAAVAAAGGTDAVFKADLSSADDIEKKVTSAIGHFGSVDVLVNNVGAGAVRTFDQLTDAEWDKTFSLNFMSYVRTTRVVLPVMRKQGQGAIVNNGSDLARQPEGVPIDYSASKAAVLALTKGLARTEGANNIRINAVAPGPIWTPFWTQPGGFAETMGKFHNMEPQKAVEHEMSLRQLPLGRLGKPEEVANVIVFLASDLASFVTSSVWGVDGGSIRAIA